LGLQFVEGKSAKSHSKMSNRTVMSQGERHQAKANEKQTKASSSSVAQNPPERLNVERFGQRPGQ